MQFWNSSNPCTFKTDNAKNQYPKIPALLKSICYDFCVWSRSIGVEPLITRVADPVAGESGVHLVFRAVDFRDETSGGADLYTDIQIEYIVNFLNTKYARNDGKPTAYHHSFKGAPRHVHLQVAASLATYMKKET